MKSLFFDALIAGVHVQSTTKPTMITRKKWFQPKQWSFLGRMCVTQIRSGKPCLFGFPAISAEKTTWNSIRNYMLHDCIYFPVFIDMALCLLVERWKKPETFAGNWNQFLSGVEIEQCRYNGDIAKIPHRKQFYQSFCVASNSL